MTHDTLLDAISTRIRAERLLARGEHVDVALSGGRDSVALLLALRALAPAWGWTVRAHHVQHGMRESDSVDAVFCEALTSELGVELVTTRFAPGELVAGEGEGPQDRARRARYAALLREARARGAVLATAHHADDALETALLMMARGSGLEGVGGLRPRRVWDGVVVVRPLLGVPRADLERWLEERGAHWVDDPTNAKRDYQRNRLRHDVIPVFEAAVGEGRVDAMRRSARLLARDAEALSALVEDVLETRAHVRVEEPAVYVPAAWLAGQPVGVAAQVIRHAARRVVVGHAPSAQALDEGLVRVVEAGRGLWRDGCVEMGRDGGYFVIRALDACEPAQHYAEIAVDVPGRYAMGAVEVVITGEVEGGGVRLVSAGGCRGEVVWERGRKRVSEVLREMGVPRRYRAGHPVLCDAAGPIGVVGSARGLGIRARAQGWSIELSVRPWYGVGVEIESDRSTT